MGIFSSITDRFKGADFDVAPNKKLKTIMSEFEENFGLKLIIYKGNQRADGNLTVNQLNKKTTLEVNKTARDLKIKASHKISDVEKDFKEIFGIKVNVCDPNGNIIPPKQEYLTLGEALRFND